MQDQPLLDKVRAEIDEIMGPVNAEARAPTCEEIQKLELVRLCLSEAGRLLRTSPRPTLNRQTNTVRACVSAITQKVGHAPISARVLVLNDPPAHST